MFLRTCIEDHAPLHSVSEETDPCSILWLFPDLRKSFLAWDLWLKMLKERYIDHSGG